MESKHQMSLETAKAAGKQIVEIFAAHNINHLDKLYILYTVNAKILEDLERQTGAHAGVEEIGDMLVLSGLMSKEELCLRPRLSVRQRVKQALHISGR